MISSNYESIFDLLDTTFIQNQAVTDAVIMYLNGPVIQKSIMQNYDPNNIYDQQNYMMNLFQENPRNYTTLKNILIQ